MENKFLPISLVTSFFLHTFALGSFLYDRGEIKKGNPYPEVVYYLDTVPVQKAQAVKGEKFSGHQIDRLLKANDSPRPAAIPIVDKKEFFVPTQLSPSVEKQASPFNLSEKPAAKMETFSKSNFKNSKSFSTVIRDARSSMQASLSELALTRKGNAARSNPLSGKYGVSVPVLQSEKVSNPRYFQYSNMIRQKIKSKAYHYIDNPHFENGEVCLSFSITSAGILKQIRIIDNKTMANDYLRSVSLRSIKEASPFPSFPRDLLYPELSFNVVITFESDKTEVK